MVRPVADRLKAMKLSEPAALMHVCGTHEHSIARAGIRAVLPEKVRLIAGPGCPVCVCPAEDIDMAIGVAERNDVILTTFGDMFRVPSTRGSMEEARGEGADVRVVYAPVDAVKIAQENPHREVVFVAVGFETTAAPISATLLGDIPDNFSIIPSLRLIPPALKFLIEQSRGEIDGFILPGHVSTVLGREGYSFLEGKEGIAGVISGFEPLDILRAVERLLEINLQGPPFRVENLYRRVVGEGGNVRSRRIIDRVFRQSDSHWRGIGMIPDSGLEIREEYSRLDARIKLDIDRAGDSVDIMPGCICHKVILGEAEPEECGLFGGECTPRRPYGPCMVSSEGTCRARYLYRRVDD